MENLKNILNSKVVGRILLFVVIFAVVSALTNGLNNKSSKAEEAEAVEAAEKYVNQQVYRSLGVPCERYKSKVIYHDKEVRLIAVDFYYEGASNPNGSYCVYCKYKHVIDSTKMMGPGYDFKGSLNELKALFGV